MCDEWQPIKTAPKDGTLVDLWIVGGDDAVDFYSPTAKKVPNVPFRHGRAADWVWKHKPPNRPNWYSVDGLGFPISPDVRVTHWMPIPKPPTGTSFTVGNDAAGEAE